MDQAARSPNPGSPLRGDRQSFLFGPFRLNLTERSLQRDGAWVPLGARAFEILALLVQRPGQLVGHDELVARVWQGIRVSSGTPRVHLAALRKALECRPDRDRYIVNVPGRGYCFVAPVETAGAAGDMPPAENPRPAPAIFGRAAAGDGWLTGRGVSMTNGSHAAWGTRPAPRAEGQDIRLVVPAAATLPTCVAETGPVVAQPRTPSPRADGVTHYRTATIDGVDVFYREAGSPTAPVVLLLHGFPTSSHMFRNLIPLLADRYRVIAPDYPGFGQSAAPDHKQFCYTFARYATLIDALLRKLGAARYAMYVTDHGALVGYRLAFLHPGRVTALIVQNGNAYAEGLGAFWDPIKAYWADGSEARRRTLNFLVAPETTRFLYTDGVSDVSRISPDNWIIDQALLDRPGNRDIQLDLLRDYGANVRLYPAFQAFFRDCQPPTLILWGRNDRIFPAEGAGPYLRDLPEAELHLLDSGHFALEDKLDVMAPLICNFLDRSAHRN
jgi:pimeloyl-ACP methyl ester carboxylesterase/DNA-binding winged helix-turn-helix (wHTH) protein